VSAPGERLIHYLLELDDDSFFALYRNYRGPVDTPYNKHDLITDLRDFLSRRETQERIVHMMDEIDRVVLSAIDLLGAPDERRLGRFLEGELEYAQLRDRILNLKDRLLLIDGREATSVELNPVLAAAARDAGLGPHQLVAGAEIPPHERRDADGPPWLSVSLSTALYAFLRDTGDLFTRTGSIRKRASGNLDAQFGELLSGETGALRLRTAVVALETLGLARRQEEQVHLRPESWEELTALPDRWIQALLWGAVLTSSVERAFEYAELLLELNAAMDPMREFTLGEVLRLMQLTGNGMTLPVDRDTVFRLTDIGFLLVHEERFRLNPSVPTILSREYAGSGQIRVQANMEVTLPPGVSYSHALTVARVAELGRYDVVPTFRLTENAVAAARRDGIERPLAQLLEITGELPQNVRFLLDRWQTRAGAVRIVRSLVVIANEAEAEILRAAEEFQQLVREEPSPGLFLVQDDTRRLERILTRLELGAAAAVEGQRPVDVDVPEYDRLFQRFRQPSLIRQQPTLTPAAERAAGAPDAGAGAGGTEPTGEAASGGEAASAGDTAPADLRTALRTALEEQDLPEDVRQELALRIERKLILFPDQIRGDVIPQYGTEARGLDYLGKIRLIEQAIGNGDLLEVIMRASSGSPQRVLVQPREIVESGDDLMLRARQEPDHQAIRIRIRRISLVRRLSGTLLRRSPR